MTLANLIEQMEEKIDWINLLIFIMWQKLICGCALCLAIANLVGNIAYCLINDIFSDFVVSCGQVCNCR